jgi:hypothetical protein
LSRALSNSSNLLSSNNHPRGTIALSSSFFRKHAYFIKRNREQANKHRQPRQKGNQRSPRAKKVKMAKNKGRAFSSKSRDEVSLSTVIV